MYNLSATPNKNKEHIGVLQSKIVVEKTIQGVIPMCSYHHLTTVDRGALCALLSQHYSIRYIAKYLQRSPSTILRELHRNGSGTSYSPDKAQAAYQYRKTHLCGRKCILSNPANRDIIVSRLECNWSPEEISNRLMQEGNKLHISSLTIYRAIRRGILRNGNKAESIRYYTQKLRHHGKPRHKKNKEDRRGKFPIAHTIHELPQEAISRKFIGIFEQDTVLGKQRGACLLTITDRKTGFELIRKVPGKKAEYIWPVIVDALSSLPKGTCKLLISDRGKEFAKYGEVAKHLNGIKTYFCDPHAPWQRGTNENTNGLIRQYLPKGKSIDDISDEEIQSIQDDLNTRPRKRLGWKTPYELFYGRVLHLI